MAEEERRMERHVFGASPATPTASSAGPSSAAAAQPNLGSIDWNGVGPKKASLSGTGPPRPTASTSLVAASGSSSHRPVCRPWECGDFLRRLATFRPSRWSQKPQVVGPAACARKGWINADVDDIACECCEEHLYFTSQPEVAAAVENFRERLETGHKHSCPWKGNGCPESLAQFPSSLMALVGGYNDRCDALLQLQNIPLVSGFVIDQMKLSRGPQIDRLLSQSPPIPGSAFRDKQGETSNHAFYKAQRLISLCGWEARLLPHAADFEDYSAQSTRNTSHKRGKRTPIVYSKAEKEGDSKVSQRTRAASAILECNYCGANVNVTGVPSVARPGTGGSSVEYMECEKKLQTLVRGASAASSIGELRNLPGDPVEDATGRAEGQVSGFGSAQAAALPPAPRPLQPEGSEMGDCGMASYESRREEQQGTSSICMPRLRAAVSESGTNGEGDEVDKAEGKSSAAESSKRKRLVDSSSGAGDQLSLGMASASATGEADVDAEVGDNRKNKKVCIDRFPAAERAEGHEQSSRGRRRGLIPVVNESLRAVRRIGAEFPCSSSVNATDTCFQTKRENSMDSVEFMPQDDAQQHTAASGYTENEWLFDDPNSIGQQAQNSGSNARAQRGTTDEDTNAAVISTGTGTAGGGSVAMGGGGAAAAAAAGGSHRVQSNEADIVGVDFSEHQTESVAGEAEVVIDAVENQGHSGDIGLVCDSVARPVTPQDGSDAVLSLCPGVSSAKDAGGADSGESGSKASLRPRNGFFMEEERTTVDTTKAVIVGTSATTKEATDASVEAAMGNSYGGTTTTAVAPLVAAAHREVEERQFDPVRRHRSFCPWVNGLVLAAANGTFGSSREAACGWQLTLDALDAFQMQLGAAAGATESESTASMCKASRLL